MNDDTRPAAKTRLGPEQESCSVPALLAKGLTKHYRLGGEVVRALRGVSLSVATGEFVAVMGPSGSGKSTLLHLLGLLEPPDSGEVHIEGQLTSGLDDDQLTRLRRDRLGFVFQSFELIPNLSARENILLPAEVSGRRDGALKYLERLATVLGISDRLHHRPRELSGGQRQRIALARALINRPVLILADEPTGTLDSQAGVEVLQLLRQGVDRDGWTILMVTHNPKAALVADRIVFLSDGNLVGEVRTGDVDAGGIIEAFVGT